MKNTFIFLILITLTLVLPDTPLANPWIGISLQRIIFVLLAVSSIQLLGVVILNRLSSHSGVMLLGLISGMISSTAFTVTLAKKSKIHPEQSSVDSLGFFTATLAMLGNGLILMLITEPAVPRSTLLLFIVPFLITLILLIKRAVHTKSQIVNPPHLSLDWMSITKLALIVCMILIASYWVKIYSGDLGLKVITFFVGALEIHGSIVANTQLFANKELNLKTFNDLISICITASYLAKLSIVYLLGCPYLKKKITLWTTPILSGLFITWMIIN